MDQSDDKPADEQAARNRGSRPGPAGGEASGSGAGAGGGGNPEDYDSDPQSGGGSPAMPRSAPGKA